MWTVSHELQLPLAPVTIARRCWTTFGIVFWISLFSHCAISVNAQADARTNTQNVTVPLTSDRMVFSPFLCDNAERILRPDECAGAWFAADVPGLSSSAVMTFGRNSTDPTDVIPQMFFQFRATWQPSSTYPRTRQPHLQSPSFHHPSLSNLDCSPW
ncbi:hypothetical protein BKA70DRAFT_468534 [Coprinopsis sp. MPI-PUGE-AT-0042]|nr:hypothetical protein BKA70DRAFT_468534 [Coprinopsis sp. MPI-PUGE-AT-0042]